MISRLAVGLLLVLLAGRLWAADIYVSPAGDDKNSGTKVKPFASIARARDAARKIKGQAVTVLLREGT